MALKYLYVPSGVKTGKAYGVLPNSANADFSSFVSDTDGTRVDENGLIVDVEANVPRLDYTGGGCPSLLLEPESTNLIDYSEDFSNVFWNKNQAVITSTNNVSPDGTNNATLLTDDNSGGTSTDVGLNEYAFALPSAGTYAFSVFVKKGTIKVVRLSHGGYDTDGTSSFNLETGVVVSKSANHETATIEEYANGFFRIAVTFNTTTDLTGSWNLLMASDAGGAITKDGTNTLYVYGAQAEKLPYASSYIPTNGSAVTRSGDNAGSTGDISVDIDSGEGVFFAEIAYFDEDQQGFPYISISDGTADNRISIQKQSSTTNEVAFSVRDSDVSQCFLQESTIDKSNYFKIAGKYKQDDFALFVNGNKINADTSGSVPTGLNTFSFDKGNTFSKFFGRVRQIRIYDEVLSDNELEELTTL